MSSAVAIPALTFGVVSMAKLVETMAAAQRKLQDAKLQLKAKQRHEAYLAAHPEEAQDLVRGPHCWSCLLLLASLCPEQSCISWTLATAGRSWWPCSCVRKLASGGSAACVV